MNTIYMIPMRSSLYPASTWRSSLHLSIVGINNHNIDLDSARTLLSAAVLATAQVGEVTITIWLFNIAMV